LLRSVAIASAKLTIFFDRSEELRRARNEEARQLISQRTENPRAVFERNTSVGQLNYRRAAPNPKSPNADQPPKPSNPVPERPVEVEKPKPVTASPPKTETSPKSEIVKPPRNDIAKSAASNAANANMVSTDDIVVPPPDSFGNDDQVSMLRHTLSSSLTLPQKSYNFVLVKPFEPILILVKGG
jgi:hypothetical protein